MLRSAPRSTVTPPRGSEAGATALPQLLVLPPRFEIGDPPLGEGCGGGGGGRLRGDGAGSARRQRRGTRRRRWHRHRRDRRAAAQPDLAQRQDALIRRHLGEGGAQRLHTLFDGEAGGPRRVDRHDLHPAAIGREVAKVKPPGVVPGGEDPGAVRHAKFGGGGMVAAGRRDPRAGFLIQFLEEIGGIPGVRRRIERLGEVAEGIAVIAQIDLHAADVDAVHPARLQGLDRGDRGADRREVTPLPLGINCPGPGNLCLPLRIPAPGFGQGDRLHQAMRNALGALFLGDRLRAQVPRVLLSAQILRVRRIRAGLPRRERQHEQRRQRQLNPFK